MTLFGTYLKPEFLVKNRKCDGDFGGVIIWMILGGASFYAASFNYMI
jgi:hypothetical protein